MKRVYYITEDLQGGELLFAGTLEELKETVTTWTENEAVLNQLEGLTENDYIGKLEELFEVKFDNVETDESMELYYIDGKQVEKSDFESEMEADCRESVYENYDDMLDELYPTVEICGIEFMPSTILHQCDPIAYNCYFDDYVSDLLSNLQCDLDGYDATTINDKEYRIIRYNI